MGQEESPEEQASTEGVRPAQSAEFTRRLCAGDLTTQVQRPQWIQPGVAVEWLFNHSSGVVEREEGWDGDFSLRLCDKAEKDSPSSTE